MFYAPKHAQTAPVSPARRRVAGVALVGATAAAGTAATAGSASAAPSAASASSASSASTATVWDRVAACESGGNWSINTGNGFYGGLQFTAQTWRGFGGAAYAPNAHQATKSQQIAVAQKVLQVQGPGAWPVCSVRAGLTKANGGAVSAGDTRSSGSTASRSTTRSGALKVNGVRNAATNRAIERWIGARQDGTMSTKWDVHRLQKKVRVFSPQRNGWLHDPHFVKKLQRTVGASVDGQWGPETTRKLQAHLNKR